MGTAIDGLVSGLKTTDIINSLMSVEALPQTQLKTKLASNQTIISTLQSFNTKLTALKDLSVAGTVAGALNLFTATSSSPAITAKTTTVATAGSIDLTVTQLAQTQVSVTAAMTSWPSNGGVPEKLTIVDSTGKKTEIAPSGTSLDDVVSAINAASAGAHAVKVPAGNGSYRLQLTATTAGAAGAFTAYQGTSAQVGDGTAVDLMAEPGAAVVKSAQDAKATLYAGTPAAQVLTSGTNTFADVLPGVSVTATAVTTAPVTVTVASDVPGITKKAEDLVKSVNDVLGFIAIYSAVSKTTDAKGATVPKAGIFTGNSTVRAVNDQVLTALSRPIDGKSPSEYGINITKAGDFTFDADKFAKSLAADPAATQAAVQGLAARLAEAATAASDPYKGAVSGLIKGRESEVRDLGNRIADWDQRLITRRATLQSVYTNMEVLLGGLQSQSAWLSGQISSLSKQSSGA
ncbi:flagellar filament capping protein FliD [Paenarthrobacter nitroguajacolicus]|uniref:flagellar filament capping protein FliD n=1 Tax=Paenarthrobacter nitroguajacolicus TaxID=211146 RepID=UPI00285D1219|nr:flagellar filament capping protein FliD [Paenarthrobacter nitroguajacolicus]MDR6637199.1 flagellar hook-associated protein 2 [Paenarthrobacter nitroguajacolicus]